MEPNRKNTISNVFLQQTRHLYKNVPFSALLSVVVALVAMLMIGPHADMRSASAWFAIICLISVYRWGVSLSHRAATPADQASPFWRLRFRFGALLAATGWASAYVLLWSADEPAYQAVTVLVLAGVAAAALASMLHDKISVTGFFIILLVGGQARLLWEFNTFTLHLAVLILLYHTFLLRNGLQMVNRTNQLLDLRQDIEEHNVAFMSTTERVARLGYWKWELSSDNIELSENLAKMCDQKDPNVNFQDCLTRIHEGDRAQVQEAIDLVRSSGDEQTLEFRMRNQKDAPWVTMKQVIKRITDTSGQGILLGTVQDVSAIRRAEQEIYDLAYYDTLTGLPNRARFMEQLGSTVVRGRRYREPFAVMFIDLDGFKDVNDSLGHQAGDELLKVIGERLRNEMRDSDFAARMGGDEFCIVADQVERPEDAANLAVRILGAINQSMEIDRHTIKPRASIGISLYPSNGEDVSALIQAADTAMYEAKRKGKHRFAFYSDAMTDNAVRRMALDAELQNAVEENQFELYYQPQVDLRDRTLRGVEALIRWHHPDGHMVPPGEFISAAERLGLMPTIGRWVIHQACRQMLEWKAIGLPDFRVSVNIDSSHFEHYGFVDEVKALLELTGVDRSLLELEITESMARDVEAHIDTCKRLQDLGVRVAIDDFGTGYSSLAVLKRLHVNTLKIDKLFVDGLIHDSDSETESVLMLGGILAMARGLRFDTVIEGVETVEQLLMLDALGCSLVQGYLFSKPVPADQIPALLEETAFTQPHIPNEPAEAEEKPEQVPEMLSA